MTVDPTLQTLLDELNASGGPDFADAPIDDARVAVRGMASLMQDPVGLGRVEALEVPGAAGPLPARLYVPGGGGPVPLVVFFHGGGWVMGDPELVDAPVRHLADRSGCAILSATHRLAPEHRFPAPLEDAWSVLSWAADDPGRLDIDASRIAVAGESTGANLAAAAALRARDEGLDLDHQLLIYPALDVDLDRASYRENAEGRLLTRAAMRRFWGDYLGATSGRVDPMAAPLRAPDLAGVAPATIATCQYDPLRDEGDAYGQRLLEAGVPVTARCFAGLTHGAWYMAGRVPAAAALSQWIADALAGALAPSDTATVAEATS